MKRCRGWWVVVCGLMAVLSLGTASDGQETPLTPATEQGQADAETADEQLPIREQTIYVPYNRLRGVFEADGRGVFLPYEKFQDLWKRALAADQATPDTPPPVGGVITSIESVATVEEDVVRVAAELSIELLGEGWHEIPLRLADAAIRSATIDGEPARIVIGEDQSASLLLKNDTADPTGLTLSLEYVKAYTKTPGQNSVAFQPPRAAVNRWQIRVPQKGVAVNVQPMLAATEVPDDSVDAVTDETVVMAFVGAAPSVRIDWTPKAEGASGMAALATAQVRQEVVVDEGIMRTRAQLTYDVSRAELAVLSLDVPLDQKVTRVLDANVRQWDVEELDDRQRITAELFEPVRGSQELAVELEKLVDVSQQETLRVATLEAVGVSRQQGVVVVRLAEELRAEARATEGLLQLDASELPGPLQSTAWDFAYRYAAMPFTLDLAVEEVQPRIAARQLLEASIEPDELLLEMGTVFEIEDAGVFQLEFDVPADYEVRRVQGRPLGDAQPVAVDAFHLDADTRRLEVNLAGKAIGKVGLLVTLARSLNDANLTTPTGVATSIAIPLPVVATPTYASTGRMIVLGPESLQLTVGEASKMRDIPLAEARQEIGSVRTTPSGAIREVMAFAFAGDEAALTLAAERRRPEVSVRQLLSVRIDPGLVKYAATLTYDIRYSPVSRLRVDLPADLVSQVRVPVSSGINKTTITPQPDDVAEDFVAVELTGESEFLGQVVIPMTWEEVVDELSVGETATYAVPAVLPQGADRAWGQIVIAKAETLDVRQAEGLTGLRPIDPQHDLMPGAAVGDAVRAFEFTDAWSLALVATRYELEEVKRASIERALVRMVVTRGDEITVQAIYRIRSVLQRLAVTLPAESQFDMDMLSVNGQPKPLERGEGNQLFIPLADCSPESPCLVEMRYTVPGTFRQLDLPVFPAQEGLHTAPAIQKVALAVYLPEELAVVAADGPWTNDQAEWYFELNRLPLQARSDAELISWVGDGIAADLGRLQSFPTDGRLYRFTTLRPAAPPDGSLRLTAVDDRLLGSGVLAGLALLGLLFVRARLGAKLAVLVVLIASLAVVGVFFPIIAMQLFDQYLAIGAGTLILLWIIGAASSLRPRKKAAPPVPTSPQAPASEKPIEPADGDEPAVVNGDDAADEKGDRTDA